MISSPIWAISTNGNLLNRGFLYLPDVYTRPRTCEKSMLLKVKARIKGGITLYSIRTGIIK
jgi:hypothetical protein